MRKVLARSILVALVTLAGATPGWAQEGVTPLNTSLSDADLDRRIQFLEGRLDASKSHGQYWYWGWLTLNAGSMVGNGVAAALTNDHDDTVDHAVSAVLGAIGTADKLLRPLEARYGASPMRGMATVTREQKIAKLRKGEAQLRSNAERAEERWGLVNHASGAGLALAAGLVVGLWGETGAGIITGVTTLLGSTATLLTEPAAPEQDWKDYKAMAGGRADLTKTDIYVSALPDGARAGIRITW
jgi:hypothetical protein